MRDNFTVKTKDLLAKRVNYHCSNPSCFKMTSGPHTIDTKSVNLGVAAHITAASKGGARFDPILSPEARMSAENGIWLCHKCAKIIDSDETRFTVEILKDWKTISEKAVDLELLSGINPLISKKSDLSITFRLKDNSIRIPKFLTRKNRPKKIILEGFWLQVYAENTGNELIHLIKSQIKYDFNGYSYKQTLTNEYRESQDIDMGNGKTQKIKGPPLYKHLHVGDKVKLGSFRVTKQMILSNVNFRVWTTFDNNNPKIELIDTKNIGKHILD